MIHVVDHVVVNGDVVVATGKVDAFLSVVVWKRIAGALLVHIKV